MSVRKRTGARGVTWQVVLERGTDAVTGKRIQQRVSKDPATGQPMLTRKRALEVEREALVRRHTGQIVDPDRTRLAVYLERWLDETTATHSAATHYQYRTIIRTRIAPVLGSIPLSALDPLTLTRFYRELGTRYAPTTVTATHTCLRAALKQAVRWRLIARSPTDDVKLSIGKAKEKTVWTKEEARTFLASTDDALWRFLVDSLCRLGEALALTWQFVNLDAGEVEIAATRSIGADGKTVTRTGTKRGGGRRISLMPETVSALRRHRTAQLERRLQMGPYWEPMELVFDRGDGLHYHPDTVRTKLRKACVAAGVPAITPHGLRHTGATFAVAQGVPLHAVMSRLGHADISLTASLYAHASQDADRGVAEALRQVLES